MTKTVSEEYVHSGSYPYTHHQDIYNKRNYSDHRDPRSSHRGSESSNYHDHDHHHHHHPHDNLPGMSYDAYAEPLPYDDGLPGIPFQAYSNSQSPRYAPAPRHHEYASSI